MYAVVYLCDCDCKIQIVVPKQFIRALSQQNLDNYGKNRNVSYVIYYNKEVCENGLDSAHNVMPKFDLDKSTQYPPVNDETCYNAQIKYFFGE